MAKVYRVIQIQLNHSVKAKNLHVMLTYQQSVFKRYHSDQHFSVEFFYLQDGGKNQRA